MQSIKISNLNFYYKKKKIVYQNLNLTIQQGHIYALLGKNGSGKTTLFNIIAGLLFPKSGNCSVFEHSSQERFPKMLEQIFVLSEGFEMPSISIKQYLKLYSDFYPNFDIKLFKNILNEFEIDFDNNLKNLSHGDKKKVYLSFALATRCKLLLLDEPTNGLDIPSKSTFRRIISSSFYDDQTIIIATHLVNDISSLCDATIIENDGQILINAFNEEITKQLSFNVHHSNIDPENLIYFEDNLSGTDTVSVNTNGFSGNLNMELLFNATLTSPEKVSNLLKSYTHEVCN